MRDKKWIILWLGCCVAALLGPVAADAQTTANLDALLIHASNQPKALDTRLDRIEYRLRRIFNFEHYGVLGHQQTLLTLPAQLQLDLGHGYRLQLDARSRDGRVQAQVVWMRGGERLLTTSVNQSRGTPAVLGGPPHDGGTLILVLTFE
jgi:hypothetical protein